MSKRHLSLTLPFLLALAACSGPEAPAPAAPAAEAPAATPAETAPAASPEAAPQGEAAGTEAASAPAQDAPAAPVAPAAPQGPAPVAGVDYIEISGGQPFQPATGRIEVAEVFGYTCPHCAHFEPVYQAWKQRQPADVNAIHVPAAFGGYWTPYARAYFTAEALGVLPQTHDAVFNAIHVQRTLPVSANVGAKDLAPFYAQHGVDAKRFTDTFDSFGIDAKINRAKQFAVRSKIDATPTIVVNGKYTVPIPAAGPEKMLQTVDWLVAQERGAR